MFINPLICILNFIFFASSIHGKKESKRVFNFVFFIRSYLRCLFDVENSESSRIQTNLLCNIKYTLLVFSD
jgi:hypothetical protein